jgi:hypothetical protein
MCSVGTRQSSNASCAAPNCNALVTGPSMSKPPGLATSALSAILEHSDSVDVLGVYPPEL